MIIELGCDVSEPHQRAYVRAWQRIAGLYGQAVDGKPGPVTIGRLKAWQAARGVEPDGVVGDLTRAALRPDDFIKPHEGCVLQAYDDAAGPLKDRLVTWQGGVWRRADGALPLGYVTIGWGTRLWPGSPRERAVAAAGGRCTQAEADRWLSEFVNIECMPLVRRYVFGDAGQICATAALSYNAPRALVRLAEEQFSGGWWTNHYNTSKGVLNVNLVNRRAEEWALYSSGADPGPKV